MATSQTTFDRYQFERSPQPVRTDLTGNGFQTTGISFDDYHSMHLEKKKVEAQRRLETPAWAMNDLMLRDVIVRFMEMRANFRRAQLGTPQERLARAIKRQLFHKPRLEEIITKLAREYVTLKKAGNPARLNKLGQLIESIDTEIRFLGKEHTLALGVIYRYYRCGEDSVAVGNALGIKPPHVRQLLWRINKAANKPPLFVAPRVSMRINMLRYIKLNPFAAPRNGEYRCWVCGVIFKRSSQHKKLCGAKCRKKRQADRDKARCAGKPAPPRYFCSPECKLLGWTIKKAAVVLKSGIGTFTPIQSSDAYLTYCAYCKVIGTEPIPREAWSQGGLVSDQK
jgi:hypothetical protein